MTRQIDTVRLAAHELRAPLAVIKGYLALLSDGTFPIPIETRVRVVDVLVAKAGELGELLDRWLVEPAPQMGTTDAVAAVRDAIARLRSRVRLEGAHVYYPATSSPIVVRANADHVARILDNLLNNALDYSPRPAKVAVAIREGSPTEIVVRDWGRGIPDHEREAVFLPFIRGGDSRGRGFGLGLAISRELAMRNQAELLLGDTSVGQGSTFVLRLLSQAEREL